MGRLGPWDLIAVGAIIWLLGGIAAVVVALGHDRPAIVIAAAAGALGLFPVLVGAIALGVRLGMESRDG